MIHKLSSWRPFASTVTKPKALDWDQAINLPLAKPFLTISQIQQVVWTRWTPDFSTLTVCLTRTPSNICSRARLKKSQSRKPCTSPNRQVFQNLTKMLQELCLTEKKTHLLCTPNFWLRVYEFWSISASLTWKMGLDKHCFGLRRFNSLKEASLIANQDHFTHLAQRSEVTSDRPVIFP